MSFSSYIAITMQDAFDLATTSGLIRYPISLCRNILANLLAQSSVPPSLMDLMV